MDKSESDSVVVNAVYSDSTGVITGKCPHCGAHMRLRERKTGYCPECGKKLDD